MSPLKATLYTAPTTSICVLPVALALEGAKVFNHELQDGLKEGLLVLTTMTLIASLVFCLIMSEYWLVGVTSSLALSVAGVFKELLTIGAGILIFAERVDLLNVVGFTICQIGILVYVFLRYDRSVAYSPIDVDNQQHPHPRPPPHTLGESPEYNSNSSGGSIISQDESEECFVDEAESLELSTRVRYRLK